MAQGSFKAEVDAWVTKAKGRMEFVHKESAQRVISVMQTPVGQGGNMPVDTGYLRASLVVGLGTLALPTTRPPETGGAFSFDPGSVALTIAGAEVTDPIEARYTAAYARVAEYGGENRLARRFVALAAQQWPRIVDEVVAEAKARTGG